jgi:hypothetical protein
MTETPSLFTSIHKSRLVREEKLQELNRIRLFFEQADQQTGDSFTMFISMLDTLTSHEVLTYSIKEEKEAGGQGQGGYNKLMITIQFKNYAITTGLKMDFSPLVIEYLPDFPFIQNILLPSGKNEQSASEQDLDLIPDEQNFITFLKTFIEKSEPSLETTVTKSFHELNQPFSV